jgi:hypothetical protein
LTISVRRQASQKGPRQPPEGWREDASVDTWCAQFTRYPALRRTELKNRSIASLCCVCLECGRKSTLGANRLFDFGISRSRLAGPTGASLEVANADGKRIVVAFDMRFVLASLLVLCRPYARRPHPEGLGCSASVIGRILVPHPCACSILLRRLGVCVRANTWLTDSIRSEPDL